MKKIRTLSLFLSLLLVVSVLLLPAQGTTIDHSVQNGCHSVDASSQLSDEGKLVETSKAVIRPGVSSRGVLLYFHELPLIVINPHG